MSNEEMETEVVSMLKAKNMDTKEIDIFILIFVSMFDSREEAIADLYDRLTHPHRPWLFAKDIKWGARR